MKLRTLQDWVVRPSCCGCTASPTWSATAACCGRSTSSRDPARLAALRPHPGRPRARRCKEGSLNACGGVLERGAEQFVIRSEGLFTVARGHAQRCASPPQEGTPVFVKDVADVTEGWAPRQGVVSRGRADGRRRGHRADAPRREPLGRARARARAAVERHQPRACRPTACSVDPFYDRTELVDTTLETVVHNLLEGALLVTLVLFVFLLDLRAALVVATLDPALARCARSSTCTCAACPPTCSRWARSTSASSSTAGWSSSRRSSRALALARTAAESRWQRSHPAGDRAAVRPADAVLAADHHRRLPADLPARSGSRAASSRRWRTPWSRRWSARWSSRSRWCRCWPSSRTAKPVTPRRVAACCSWAARRLRPDAALLPRGARRWCIGAVGAAARRRRR